MKCPHCKEEVKEGATTCIHCKKTIFNEDPNKNALIGVLSFIIVLIIVIVGMKACAKHEMEKIKKESGEYTEQLLKDWRK